MRTTEAARYARWAAGAAMLLAATVGGVYAYRGWMAARAREQAPPPVPATVQKQSAVFSFSKVEGERTLFTVRASRATEFKAGSKSLLEDVWITIYGRQSRRFDNIHTNSCDYEPTSGRIVCSGQVQIDLESAEEARERPGQRVIHLRTGTVSFDRESGEAHSDQDVVFRFPYGHGRGAGVTYSTREALVRLHRDVEVVLTQRPGTPPSGEPPAPRSGADAVVLTGASLEFDRNTRTLRLLPPVRVRQGSRELTAAHLALEFDAALRARRLLLGGRAELRSTEARGEVQLSADEFTVLFHPDGHTERVVAEGAVRGRLKSAAEEDRLEAQRVEMELEPGRNEPRWLAATGDVVVGAARGPEGSGRDGESRRLETSALRLVLGPDKSGRGPEGSVRGRGPRRSRGGRRVVSAETLAPGRIEFVSGEESTQVRGERLSGEFGEAGGLQRLRASSGVEVERRFGRSAAQVVRSREATVVFGPGGEWARIEQRGSFEFQEGERRVQADSATLERATDTITLSGGAAISDSLARTTADRFLIQQRRGEIRGEGNVRTTYRTAQGGGLTHLAAVPAVISAEQVSAGRESGRILYTGRARLWQGEAMIEAGALELFHREQRLEARGPEGSGRGPEGSGQGAVTGIFPQLNGVAAPGGSPAAGAEPLLWRVRAASLTYWGAERRARLSENASAQSRLGQISGRQMDLLFESAGGGAQKLVQAQASGGVVVRQGERRGTAERADYSVAAGKFVLSGGTPALWDAALGTTTGRQLTFFLADDKILIDSEEGSRTLTKHRVQR